MLEGLASPWVLPLNSRYLIQPSKPGLKFRNYEAVWIWPVEHIFPEGKIAPPLKGNPENGKSEGKILFPLSLPRS